MADSGSSTEGATTPLMTITQILAAQGAVGGADLRTADAVAAETKDGTAIEKKGAGEISRDLAADVRYEVGDMIARGGMGAVLNARDVNCRRRVAMKVMLDKGEMTPQQVVRFIEEAQVTAQLEHPSIVPVHELGVGEDGNVYYTMKLVRGTSLQAVLDGIRDGDEAMIRDYPLARLLQIYMKACDALAFAHSRGVVHRDLKPENIMLGDYGEALVVDWGLAKILSRPDGEDLEEGESGTPAAWILEDVESIRQNDESSAYRTMDGVAMGTPQYMAPEQACGQISRIDARTDIYALGGILYAILSLRAPIIAPNVQAVLMRVAKGEIENPSVYNAESSKAMQTLGDARAELRKAAMGRTKGGPVALVHCPGGLIPPSLAAVTMKAMALEQDERYQKVEDLQREIDAHLGGFATQAEEASFVRQMGLLVRRHRSVFAITGTAAAILAVVISVAVLNVVKEKGKAVAALELAKTNEVRAIANAEEAKRNADEAAMNASEARRAKDAVLAVSRQAAPVFRERAEQAFVVGNLEDAAENARIAVGLASDDYALWVLNGRLALAQLDAGTAFESFTNARTVGVPGGDERALLKTYMKTAETMMSFDAQTQDRPAIMDGLAKALAEAGDSPVAVYLAKAGSNDGDEIRMRVDSLKQDMVIANPGSKPANTVGYLPEIGLMVHFLNHPRIVDIRPLQGLPIGSLRLRHTPIEDLEPLRGMPLTAVDLRWTDKIRDLSPLAGMSLRELAISSPLITDFSLIRGMPLESFWCDRPAFSDLTLLEDAPLTTLWLTGTGVTDLSPLTGKAITRLDITNTRVTDLEPLRGMPLEILSMANTPVTSLKPLAGMPLTRLEMQGANDVDTADLRGLKLTRLMATLRVPPEILADMPLVNLDTRTAVPDDLKTIGKLPLTQLTITTYSEELLDLRHLKDLQLSRLILHGLQGKGQSLDGIQTIPLAEFQLDAYYVDSLEPLASITTLKTLKVRIHNVTPDYAPLRQMPNLEKINDRPAADFWKDWDAAHPAAP